jgi:cytidylate kinase
MLVINLWGGPGAGKSTVAAELFTLLRKNVKANCELVGEFATDLCFEQAKENLHDQIYLLGNQWHRLWRLDKIGVDLAISDSPIGLGVCYKEKADMPPGAYEKFVALSQSLRQGFPTIDIMIDRDVYAVGGFKGNSKKRNMNWLNQLDKRIAKEAQAEKTVMFTHQAGWFVYEYIFPKVIEYMQRKELTYE